MRPQNSFNWNIFLRKKGLHKEGQNWILRKRFSGLIKLGPYGLNPENRVFPGGVPHLFNLGDTDVVHRGDYTTQFFLSKFFKKFGQQRRIKQERTTQKRGYKRDKHFSNGQLEKIPQKVGQTAKILWGFNPLFMRETQLFSLGPGPQGTRGLWGFKPP